MLEMKKKTLALIGLEINQINELNYNGLIDNLIQNINEPLQERNKNICTDFTLGFYT
jgi:hypothetical protein